MKVTISVGGKFHAFYLAKQLDKYGFLDTIFTSYPYFKVKDSRIDRKKVKCLVKKEILERIFYILPYIKFKEKIDIPYYTANLFDYEVSHAIKPCDIFVGWSGFCLYTIKKIRNSFKPKIIVERGSVHIETQREIMQDEQRRLGISLNLPSSKIIHKEKEEYQLADFIVVPSNFAKESFIKKSFKREKIIVIPLGVDVNLFKPIPKEDKKFRIILVGISVQKGVHYVLKAISELRLKDIEVFLIGIPNQDIKPLLKVYKYNKELNLNLIGGIPKNQLYKYYSQGSVFILFSLEDGFGMVVLEAMAVGLPVICSTNVGAKDVVREGIDGFIVPIRDTEALKEKIIFLYEHPQLCKEMGEAARENVIRNYTWQHYGERIIETYKKIYENKIR